MYPLHVRNHAVALMAAHTYGGLKLRDAAEFLVAYCRDHEEEAPHNPHEFLHRWYNHFKEEGSAFARCGHSGEGRVADNVIARCCEVVKEGFMVGCEDGTIYREWYDDIFDAAERNPYIHWVAHVQYPGLDLYRSLYLRMRAHDPSLCFCLRGAKHGFTQEQLEQRRRIAHELMLWQFQKLMCVIWLDATSLQVQLGDKGATPRMVLASKEWQFTDAMIEKPPRVHRRTMTAHWYAAVNAIIGPVDIQFITGTTGLRKAIEAYKVCIVTIWPPAWGVNMTKGRHAGHAMTKQ